MAYVVEILVALLLKHLFLVTSFLLFCCIPPLPCPSSHHWQDSYTNDVHLAPLKIDLEKIMNAPEAFDGNEEGWNPTLIVDNNDEDGIINKEESRKQGTITTDTTLAPTASLFSTLLPPPPPPPAATIEDIQQSLKRALSTMKEKFDRIKAVKELIQPTDVDDENAMWVHSGFLYDCVREDVLAMIDAALEKQQPQQEQQQEGKGQGPDVVSVSDWTVIVTGHSLGGALATLCACDLSLRKKWKDGTGTDSSSGKSTYIGPAIKLYNYGSPRVGNVAMATRFDELIPDTWRVVNGNDAVCLVPRLMGYRHVGHEVKLGGEKSVVIIQASHAIVEAAGLSDILMLPFLSGGGGEGGEGDEEEVERQREEVMNLLEIERQTLTMLFNLESVKMHLEEQYVIALEGLLH